MSPAGISTERQRIGDNLRALRRKARLSQVELGHEAKINQSVISSIENGGRDVSGRLMARLCRALGCDASELLEGVLR